MVSLIDTVVTTEPYNAGLPNTLVLEAHETVYVLSKPNDVWWDGLVVDPDGTLHRGWFPPEKVSCPGPVDQGDSQPQSPLQPPLLSVQSATLVPAISSNSSNGLESASAANTAGGAVGGAVGGAGSSSEEVSRTSSRVSSASHTEQPQKPAPHLVPAAEIAAYFSDASHTPATAFAPMWIPQLTQDDTFVFGNHTLGVYTKDPPLVVYDEQETVEDVLPLENPDTASLAAGLYSVPLALSDSGSSDIGPAQTGSNFGVSGLSGSRRSSQSVHGGSQSVLSGSHNGSGNGTNQLPPMPTTPGGTVLSGNARGSISGTVMSGTSDPFPGSSAGGPASIGTQSNPRSTSITPHDLTRFYMSPSDFMTWQQLEKGFHESVHSAIGALETADKELFRTNLDVVGMFAATYQHLVRLHSVQLKQNKQTEPVCRALNTLSDRLVQFIINGNLFLMVSNKDYLEEARADSGRMLQCSTSFSDLFGPEAALPLIHVRFVRGRYDGGNFTNQLALDSDGAPQRQANVLLDDELVNSLSKHADAIASHSSKTFHVLENIPTDSSYPIALEHRNAAVLRSAYDCIPPIARYINTIESIDLTVFAMIARHAAIASAHQEAGGEECEHGAFYEATAHNLDPLLSDFVHLKQDLHSILTDFILDSQMLTSKDPEVFLSPTTDEEEEAAMHSDPRYMRLKVEEFAGGLLNTLRRRDHTIFHGNTYIYEPSWKLRSCIKNLPEKMGIMLTTVIALKEQREDILNYCTRLMNSDFNVASLFVAERHNVLQSTQSEYYYGRTSDSDLPWYLEADDDERKLIYDASGLKGGPFKSLIALLVDPLRKADFGYEDTLLDLFRSFCTPKELFAALKERMEPDLPEALSYQEYGDWTEKRRHPQQTKILGIVKSLFCRHWNVNYSQEMGNCWDYWCQDPAIPSELASLGKDVLGYTDQTQYSLAYHTFDATHLSIKATPVPKVLTAGIKRMRLHDLSMDEVAQQLTLMQQELFLRITRSELYARSYNFAKIMHNPKISSTKSIADFIKNCNQLTHFVIYMILRQADLIERVTTIKYFIYLAEKLLEMQNFSSMTAIVSGLSSTSISRMKTTWSLVPKATKEKFERMDRLMSIGKNYSEYRNMLKFIADDGDACLPFLGMFLSDLRFTTDGNPDYIHGDKSLINFGKRSAIFRIVHEILQFSDKTYGYERNDNIIGYLLVMFENVPDDERLYEMSLQWEPRVSVEKRQKRERVQGSGSSMFSRMAQRAKKSSSSQSGKKRYSAKAAYGI